MDVEPSPLVSTDDRWLRPRHARVRLQVDRRHGHRPPSGHRAVERNRLISVDNQGSPKGALRFRGESSTSVAARAEATSSGRASLDPAVAAAPPTPASRQGRLGSGDHLLFSEETGRSGFFVGRAYLVGRASLARRRGYALLQDWRRRKRTLSECWPSCWKGGIGIASRTLYLRRPTSRRRRASPARHRDLSFASTPAARSLRPSRRATWFA